MTQSVRRYTDMNDAAAYALVDIAIKFGPDCLPTSLDQDELADDVYTALVADDAGYRIIKKIGEGGMGVVYRAQQLGTGQMVALKAIKRELLSRRGLIARFHDEVHLAASLKHQCIARVFDSGLDKQEYYYIMELIEGDPIDIYVSREQLNLRSIAKLIVTISEAVSYAHEVGVLHLDLKPCNILVSDDGVPHILDFGLAQAVGQQVEPATHRAGSIGYIAPEYSDSKALLDHRADIYSLGIILKALITESNDFDVYERDGDLRAVVEKALASDRDFRYQSSGELAGDLTNWLEMRSVTARPRSFHHAFALWFKRNKVILWPIGLIGLIILLSLAGVEKAVSRREAAVQMAQANSNESQYVSAIASARSRIERGDFKTALYLLAATDPSDRNWEWGHLSALADQSIDTIKLADNVIVDFSVTPGGELIALASSGRNSGTTGDRPGEAAPRIVLPSALAKALSPSGSYMVAFNQHDQWEIQYLDSGVIPVALPEVLSNIKQVLISPNGRYLSAITRDDLFVVYDVFHHSVVYQGQYDKPVMISAFSRDSRKLMYYDDGYQLLDLESSKTKQVLEDDSLGRAPVALFLRGDYCYVALEGGDIIQVIVAEDTPPIIYASIGVEVAAFSPHPDGSSLAVAGEDGLIYLCGPGLNGRVLSGHTSFVVKMQYSEDGKYLYSLSSNGELKTWDVHWGAITHQAWPLRHARLHSFSRNGDRMAYSTLESGVHLLDSQAAVALHDHDSIGGYGADNLPTVLAFSRDDSWLGIASKNQVVELINLGDSRLRLTSRMESGPAYGLDVMGYDGWAVASNSNEVLLWDYKNNERTIIKDVRGPAVEIASRPGWVAWIRVSQSGYSIEVYDVRRGRQVHEAFVGTDPVMAISSAARVPKVATLSVAGQVSVHDVAEKYLTTRIEALSEDRVLSVALSPDGKRVVTAGDRVVLWSGTSGKFIDVVESDPEGLITAIGFSGDGKDLIGQNSIGYYRWRSR